jgi:hypothetical protein
MELGMLVQRGVEIGHISLVMLPVMNLHRLRVDVRFKRISGVRERGERVSHRTTS